MIQDIPLKPCPFCGGNGDFTLDSYSYFRVQCSNCSCGTVIFSFHTTDLEDDLQALNNAAEFWNRGLVLKRCPFCNSSDVNRWGDNGIHCYDCGIFVDWNKKEEDYGLPDEVIAVRKWNRRVSNDN